MDTIVVSNSSLKEGIEKVVNGKKIKVIYNGVDTRKFTPVSLVKKNELRNKLHLPLKSIIFLYVGLFIERKGVLDLLYTWEKFKAKYPGNAHLVLVGQEMPELQENSPYFNEAWPELKKCCQQKGIIQVIPFSTNVSDFYQACDAFIFFSRLEGMPNVLLEAMSSGLPVLTKEFIGFSSDYGDNTLIKLKEKNSDNVEVINSFLIDKNLQLTLGQKAREHMEKYFQIDGSVENYINLL